ncbi:MAG: GntR family transcriptional regulator [Acidimicrobiia bacterium]|nr:GntR family transcriptional regulator [Acidimicrobiia bacterium]
MPCGATSGPPPGVPWSALIERARREGIAVASVRSLAAQLGVAKNTANRAIGTLVRAGVVEAVQNRGSDGQFRPGAYRLPPRQHHRHPTCEADPTAHNGSNHGRSCAAQPPPQV